MAFEDPYVTVDAFKRRVNITTDDVDADLLEVLTSASREIEGWCGQVFNQTAPATVRYLTAAFGDVIELPTGVVSLAEVATDDGSRTYQTVWSPTDYEFGPPRVTPASHPYTELRRHPLGSYSWPGYENGVRLTGVFGWPAVPAAVKSATFMLAHRLYKRWGNPFPVLANSQMGTFRAIPGMDAEYLALLSPYTLAGAV